MVSSVKVLPFRNTFAHSLDAWNCLEGQLKSGLSESRLVTQEKKTYWRQKPAALLKIFLSKVCLQAHAYNWKIKAENVHKQKSHLKFSWYQKHTCNPSRWSHLCKAFVKLTRLWHFVAEADIYMFLVGLVFSLKQTMFGLSVQPDSLI